MSRYIGIDDAIEIVTKIQGIWATTLHALWDVPSIEIVRCKDCRHYKYTEGFEHGRYEVGYGCELRLRQVTADDFCSYGERSDNGKDIQSATE